MAEGGDIGGRLGRSAGRIVRAARNPKASTAPDLARQAIERAQPVAERAARFAQEHDDEIRQAGLIGARFIAARVAPPVAQPAIAALAARVARRTPAPGEGDRGEDHAQP